VQEVDEFAALPGLGAKGLVAGCEVLGGREKLFGERGLDVPADITRWWADQERDGRTTVLVSWDGAVRDALAVADTVNPSAAAAVAKLRRLGLRPSPAVSGPHGGARVAQTTRIPHSSGNRRPVPAPRVP
jgi:P-type Cu+ transporter